MTIDPRSFKTSPFEHQAAELLVSAELRERALWWEVGTAKTKVVLDTVAHLARQREITAAATVAPAGVEWNWATDEIPAHLAMEPNHYLPFVFQTKSSSAKWHQREVAALARHPFPFLLLSYDAWMTKAGKNAVWSLLSARPTLLTIDEGSHVKSNSSKRSKSVRAGAPHARYRRLLNGTPVDNSPFDVYAQAEAVSPGFWRREMQLGTYTDFRHFFGIWGKGYVKDHDYEDLIEYQNLDVLGACLQRIGSRVRKDDVLSLPPKLYTRRYYAMTREQSVIYDNLEQHYASDFPDDPDAMITAELAIVRMLRLQQVLCGYVPADGDEEPRNLISPDRNPRLDAMTEFVEEARGEPGIVFCQYVRDAELIVERLRSLGMTVAPYVGATPDDERVRARQAFQRGELDAVVINSVIGSEGLTLHRAHWVVFYSNSYRLRLRIQGEGRAHRAGLDHPVLYCDLVCRSTRDEAAIGILQAKASTAARVQGDDE